MYKDGVSLLVKLEGHRWDAVRIWACLNDVTLHFLRRNPRGDYFPVDTVTLPHSQYPDLKNLVTITYSAGAVWNLDILDALVEMHRDAPELTPQAVAALSGQVA